MKVKIIGGFGGPAPGRRCTSLLINDELLLDLGAASVGMSEAEKKSLKYIFLSHVHLDHIKELPHLVGDLMKLGRKSVEVHCNEFTEKALRNHVFNNILYSDITDTGSNLLKFVETKSEVEVTIGPYKIIPVSVNHPCKAFGFIVKKGGESIIFTMDTGTCPRLWEVAKAQPEKLKAVFFDLSFPNKLHQVALASGHHTSETIGEELKMMPKDVPLFSTHVKPYYLEEIRGELAALGNSRITLIDQDDLVFNL